MLAGPPLDVTEYPEVLCGYLSAGGSPAELEEVLFAWNAMSYEHGLVLADQDLTGDDAPEVIVIALQPPIQRFNSTGALTIFSREPPFYRVAFTAGPISSPELITVEDLNNNGLMEVVFTTEYCGVGTCYLTVMVEEFDASQDRFVDLSMGSISMKAAQLGFEDVDGDGTQEITLDGWRYGSLTDGPLRGRKQIFKWNNTQYELADTIYDSPTHRIHVVNDADTAWLRGDYRQAHQLYWQALEDDSLYGWAWTPYEADFVAMSDSLEAYVYFRLMVAYTWVGNHREAHMINQLYLQDYADESITSGGGFAILGEVYWQEYLQNSKGSACEAVIATAEKRPDLYAPLNEYGPANKLYAPTDLCPPEVELWY
jgi:hypothetical protein